MKLGGRGIVITGASQGLGKAIAEACIREGADVVLCARDGNLLEQTRAELASIASNGQQVIAQTADVRNRDDIHRLFEVAAEKLPRLVGLVNNAGVYGPFGLLEDVPVEEWWRAIETNLLGVLLGCCEALPIFRSSGSSASPRSRCSSLPGPATGSSTSSGPSSQARRGAQRPREPHEGERHPLRLVQHGPLRPGRRVIGVASSSTTSPSAASASARSSAARRASGPHRERARRDRSVPPDDRRLVYVNRAFASLAGLRHAAGDARRGHRRLLPPRRRHLIELRRAKLRSQRGPLPPQEYRMVRKDGGISHAEFVSMVIEYDGKPNIILFGARSDGAKADAGAPPAGRSIGLGGHAGGRGRARDQQPAHLRDGQPGSGGNAPPAAAGRPPTRARRGGRRRSATRSPASRGSTWPAKARGACATSCAT